MRAGIFFDQVKLRPLSITFSLQNKDFRVVYKAVGNRSGGSGTVKDISPSSKRQIGRNNSRLFLMPRTDNLEE